MADETTTDSPLANLAQAERDLKTDPPAQSASPAAERLRAFEDRELGEDAVRINGQIERGYGSRFKDMPESKHRVYAALENLVVTEQKLADAHAALIQADAAHEAAEAAVEAAESDDARPE